MVDRADDAANRSELFHSISLDYRKHEGPKATGKCLCCGEPLRPKMRWCDAWCRDEWTKEWRNLLPKDVPPGDREEIVVFGVDVGDEG